MESVAQLNLHIKNLLTAKLNALGVTDVTIELAPPPQAELGDFGVPCFSFAKQLKKAPAQIAAVLAQQLTGDDVIAQATAAGGFLNIRLNQSVLFTTVIGEVWQRGERYGANQLFNGEQHYMVEYSSPNTNKPLHLGHLRNNLLGASVSAILRFYGYQVTRINLVNDRGVHICKSMLAYQRWGNGSTPQSSGKKGDHFVGEFYVLFDKHFNEEYTAWLQTEVGKQKLAAWTGEKSDFKDAYFNADSQLGAQVRQLLRDWEDGQPDVIALWKTMNSWVLAGFEQSYQRMGVGFDQTQFESQTYQLGKALVQRGLDQGALQKRADGAVVCDLTRVGLTGEKVLLRSDGTSVYMTQDLGTAVERFEKFNIDKLVYVVGDEQNYHFEVLFKVLGLLQAGLTERCFHLSYGMIRLPEGKMKSREGTVVDADDLMDEMVRLAREETQQRAEDGKAHTEDMTVADLANRSEQIGLSALKYHLLKFSPKKSFEYNPKESIDFLGQTGPYCLFNYARTRSLLRKAGTGLTFDPSKMSLLGTDRELELVRLLYRFPQVISQAARTYDPSRLTEYLFELSKSFAFVFTDKTNHPIATCPDESLKQARLMLVTGISTTLKIGLNLLGITALEEM